MENVHLLTFKSCKALALTTDQPRQTPRFLHLTPPYSLSRWSRPQTCSTSTVEHYLNPGPSFCSRFIFSIITSFLPAHVLKVISDAVHFISMRTKPCVWGGEVRSGGGFIPSRGRTERRLPLCLRCCVRTFFGIDLTDVSSGIKKAADRDAGIILSDTQYAKRVPASAPEYTGGEYSEVHKQKHIHICCCAALILP